MPGGNGDERGNRRDRKVGIKRGLRQPGFCGRCGAWKGQYGLEPSFHDYIEHTRLWVREAWRVLKDDGVFFLNIGDSYASGKGLCRNPGGGERSFGKHWKVTGVHNLKRGTLSDLKKDGVKPKCKLLIPHRVAIALVDDGWILRNDIVWQKNGMPESCQDRFSKRYENVFMFVKRGRYYFDLDAVREEHRTTTLERARRGRKGIGVPQSAMAGQGDNTPMPGDLRAGGKNPGDVWKINTQPSPEKHYAMWPEKLVRRMVLCSTRPGGVVLDPFCGSATTLRVVDRLNRVGMGIDLGYQEIQERRLKGIQKELMEVR